jgi:DinB family protein
MPTYTQPTDLAGLDPKKLSQSLLLVIDEATRAAERYEERAASVRPSPEKWSVKEIFGHLVDSAGNNLQRIVRLSLEPAIDLPGYDGEAWVAMQHYADRPWSEVVTLWRALNLHLAHVIAQVNKEHLCRVWRFEGRDWTLGFIIEDYVAHLRHHLETLPAA